MTSVVAVVVAVVVAKVLENGQSGMPDLLVLVEVEPAWLTLVDEIPPCG